MPARRNGNPDVDEGTALLSNSKNTPIRNPLPWSQILVVMLIQLCEPMSGQSIFPYINQLIGELDMTGGDKRKVGYYAGLIESLFFVTQATTTFQWSRASDYIGRKPVLLTGLTGLCISILCFGLSRTFWTLVISRCICGVLNGNSGVMKSMMGDLTDSTNRADVFSLIPVSWGVGSTLGSLMGGMLSRPHDHFPGVFGGAFWVKHPYFLPCVAVASVVSTASIVTLVFLKETVQRRKPPIKSIHSGTEITPSTDDELAHIPHPQPSHDEPVPLRELLVFRVVITISNYFALAFLNIALSALRPLFCAMPIEVGGLGLSTPEIGYILGAYGIGTCTFQLLLFAKIVRRFGMKKTFFTGMSTLIPIFCLFPVMNIITHEFGMSPFIWVLLGVQVACAVIMDMAYGCIFMYLTSAAPNKRSLGSTNGLAQTTTSVARAIGPAMSTSLFSFSVEHNILGGYGVYAFLILLSLLALSLAVQLPQGEWGADVAVIDGSMRDGEGQQ